MAPNARKIGFEVQQEIERLQVRLQAHQDRRVIWERVFDEADRQTVTQQNVQERHIAEIWADLRGISVTRAVLDLTYKVNLLSQLDYEYLLRQIGEEGPAQPLTNKPIWNPDRCELSWNGEIIRRLPGRKVAKNVVCILDAFQDDGWPDRIDNPLTGGSEPHKLRETIYRLNKGLRAVRFRADGTGDGILWEPLTSGASQAPFR